MAIIKRVQVSIVSGGKELPEYRPLNEDTCEGMEDASDDTQVKYIQGIPDANFMIRYRVKKNFRFGRANAVNFKCFVDGKYVRGRVCTKDMYRKEGGVFNRTYEGPSGLSNSGQRVRHLFRWASLASTDKPCGQEDREKYKDLGTIKVEVWREQGGFTAQPSRVWKGLSQNQVPEKAIKGEAIDLRTCLDTRRPSEESSKWNGANVDDKPYAVFIFKYRGNDSLKALGILERPQTPQPLEERDIETLSPDELKEMARRYKAEQEAKRIKIKKENAEINLAQLADLKRERKDVGDDEDEVEFLSEQPVKRVCSIGPVIDDSE
ncbi:uncharacterized protein Z520_03628 [Fonsecaea multimorphosa CBS 102226]|uniref:DUF7918 domain-containing protein n=1 Tax=Fonsecaea multimorphosa CBS 102226 TaxID=1442371 RepID=A0A0D2IV83_9EURO|nr:uncharacterized protein Z520_03628 [Fonsecaea multimorphosa CBS 102226]KIY00962.1 hypothetical protein Z520_03628 [Fonsecaea multimorphosa CBS 102226]